MSFDENKFYELLDEFADAETPIIRKNASKDPEKEEARLTNVISAYNALIRYTGPVFESNDKKLRAKIKPELIDARNRLIECLNILGSTASVPELLTEGVDDKNMPNNSNDNTNENNTNVKPNTENTNIEPNTNNQAGGEDKKPKQNEQADKNIDNIPSTSNTNNSDSNKNAIEKKPTNSKKNNDNKKTDTMAMSTIEYYNLCTRQLNTMYSGDPLGLPPFIDAITLLQQIDTTNEHSEILKGVILTKLQGTAREILPTNATIEQIKITLVNKIKPENSKVVLGRMVALKADRTNMNDYAKRAENLAEQFKRSLILENVPNEKASEMTIDQTIELCRTNTRSSIVKSVLAATKYEDAKEVVAKFIIESRTDSTEINQAQILRF